MNKTQITVLLGSVFIVVLLLFANTKLPDNPDKKETSDHAGASSSNNILTLVEASKAKLDVDQRKIVDQLEAELEIATDKTSVFEKLIEQGDLMRQPVAAAYYMEKAATVSGNELHWKEAGDRYYAATRFVVEAEKPVLFTRALDCFEKVLAINPDNIEAKIKLASCYVEGSAQPMKGIGMLRDIEKVDSNNVNLQMSFAFFSEKSGQWDKAIYRFEKILKIQPSFIEAYLHLADAYDKKGDKDKVIENLEKYITLVDDVAIKSEVQDYINKLKN